MYVLPRISAACGGPGCCVEVEVTWVVPAVVVVVLEVVVVGVCVEVGSVAGWSWQTVKLGPGWRQTGV